MTSPEWQRDVQVTSGGPQVVEPLWIALSDGRRLSARLFLPDTQPAACLLEILPYRHRDETRDRDDAVLGWYARNGYAAIRVESAGTGGSEGLLTDEYSPQELADAVEVIAWVAAQQWCTGSVGMFGYSWGGIAALQVAALRPPALKAVVSAYSSDDRFARDAHYAGGALLGDMFSWGAQFLSAQALPPDPVIVGAERWREMWSQRLDALPLTVADWLSHQTRDVYWRRGSVCETPPDVPVLAIGGWADGYTATVLRLLERQAHCKGIIGPWPHQEPNFAPQGIDYLQQCKFWWDRWLKNEPNGIEDAPALRAFLEDRWVGVDWPGPGATRSMTLGAGRVQTPLTLGQDGPDWCPFDLERPIPDQGAEDLAALCFDGAPLAEELTLLGECRLNLRLASDRPQAQLAARLNAIAPDGSVTLLTHGVLNLAHRFGSEDPTEMPPGQVQPVTLVLKPLGRVVPAGHRLRVALSSGYWPMIWPAPEAATLTIESATLDLPLAGPLSESCFGAPDGAAPAPVTQLTPPQSLRQAHDDGMVHIDRLTSSGQFRRDDIGTVQEISHRERRSAHPQDPLRARAEVEVLRSYSRPDWQAALRVRLEVTCDAENFHLTARVEADEGTDPLRRLTLTRSIARHWI